MDADERIDRLAGDAACLASTGAIIDTGPPYR